MWERFEDVMLLALKKEGGAINQRMNAGNEGKKSHSAPEFPEHRPALPHLDFNLVRPILDPGLPEHIICIR